MTEAVLTEAGLAEPPYPVLEGFDQAWRATYFTSMSTGYSKSSLLQHHATSNHFLLPLVFLHGSHNFNVIPDIQKQFFRGKDHDRRRLYPFSFHHHKGNFVLHLQGFDPALQLHFFFRQVDFFQRPEIKLPRVEEEKSKA